MSLSSTVHGSKSLLFNVIRSMNTLYPLELADKSWDNTGLLLESPFIDPEKRNVMLTIDLTKSVTQEAIQKNVGVIVAYHPIIFRGLKSLTMGDSQQSSLLRLAAAGISVYCPHTSLDAAREGLNDWLADGVSCGPENEASRQAIEESQVSIEGHEGSGMGRLVTLKEGVSFMTLIKRIKSYLALDYGGLEVTSSSDCSVQASIADHHKGTTPTKAVETIGICAGSGGSIFRNIKADVLFTGELGHHELLACLAAGTSCIICGHSNTERGFLTAVMQHKLAALLPQDSNGGNVFCSECDRDPLVTI